LVHFLQQSFEAMDVFRPEDAVVGDPIDERFHSSGFHAVVHEASFTSGTHEAGLLQRGEMLGYRRLRDVETAP
jgi:hypothetical protein